MKFNPLPASKPLHQNPIPKSQKPKQKWINPLGDRTRVVPFVVPTQQERMAALGSLAGEKWRIKKSLQAIIPFFDPIKKPEPGDNLFEYEQEGQTFPLFSSMNRNYINKEQQIIYIATFHSKLSEERLKQFKGFAKAFFHGIKIKLHKYDSNNTDLSEFAPMQSENGITYYDGTKLNNYFSKKLPKKCYSIAILTDLLIYNGNNPVEQLKQKLVFGLGSIKDRTSLISFTQIIKKGYQNPIPSPQILSELYQEGANLQFLVKVIHHELCHTFGMKHCIFYTCLMNGSNHYEEAVRKDPHLCVICVRKLQCAIQFDIMERYAELGETGDNKSVNLAAEIRKIVGENK